ncbi:hypothetical protein TL16_g03945 [Triparma laevis f. inornata]|uniref:Uncharacterized protein n=2 Tax=Triparma laevis TaxID=1534972 RepID=A0A9W7DYU7_9STRA|nr:hypothetical protein TrLO_g4488 [Triparma laevis f. longispina]GMH64365.1 hypothetical protein TL16_g03945 [Triparma laevis f. inornata]
MILSTSTYTKAFATIFGVYGLQMLFVPANMVTDHFEAEPTPMLKFWIRGQSVSLLGLCYCLTELPEDKAALIGTITSLAVGVLYPWNAKFGLLNKDLPVVKYPMHYVPEALMGIMTLAGAASLLK